jgi:hypothetical protein
MRNFNKAVMFTGLAAGTLLLGSVASEAATLNEYHPPETNYHPDEHEHEDGDHHNGNHGGGNHDGHHDGNHSHEGEGDDGNHGGGNHAVEKVEIGDPFSIERPDGVVIDVIFPAAPPLTPAVAGPTL